MARRLPPSRWQPSEHLRAIHSPPGRDLAADGRGGARRHCGVPASARGAPAAGRLSNHSGHRHACRRQRRDHGVIGGDAAGAAARPDSRRYRDDLIQRARRHLGHGSVRPQPQHRPCRPGCAGGDHGCRQDTAADDDDAADLQEAQSSRCADPGPCGPVRHLAADAGGRIRRQLSRAANLAGSRASPRLPSAASSDRRSGFRSIRPSSRRAD